MEPETMRLGDRSRSHVSGLMVPGYVKKLIKTGTAETGGFRFHIREWDPQGLFAACTGALRGQRPR
jgi:hypothetical protein